MSTGLALSTKFCVGRLTQIDLAFLWALLDKSNFGFTKGIAAGLWNVKCSRDCRHIYFMKLSITWLVEAGSLLPLPFQQIQHRRQLRHSLPGKYECNKECFKCTQTVVLHWINRKNKLSLKKIFCLSISINLKAARLLLSLLNHHFQCCLTGPKTKPDISLSLIQNVYIQRKCSFSQMQQ